MTEKAQQTSNLADNIKTGLLDDILAQIDAAYANYKQTPVFTCQEEELAYWSRITPADSGATPATPSTPKSDS